MTWVLDNSHTHITFSVKHMMISTVRGEFTKFEGTVNLNEENLAASVVEGKVYLDSINTRDEKRDGHLRSADFFDVETYPVMTFVSKRIEAAGGNVYRVVGDLTIKDVTREIVLTVNSEGRQKSPWGTEVWGFNAEASLNRKDFGLNWNVALETGGVLVGEQVKIAIEAELIKVQQPEATAAN